MIHLPMRTSRLTEAEIIVALMEIQRAQKPVLIHCWHGSDRTGVVVAAYRIVFENWTIENAIAEFRQKEYGYHESWYPHLVNILENLDVEAIKSTMDYIP
ncbi:hypothetical protein BBFL7_01008 [Flavobacteria bacterium BBFL7]|nr:hypothetical protein BBFL7_01008 [Flavobacteria bacterium BBFL7]